ADPGAGRLGAHPQQLVSVVFRNGCRFPGEGSSFQPRLLESGANLGEPRGQVRVVRRVCLPGLRCPSHAGKKGVEGTLELLPNCTFLGKQTLDLGMKRHGLLHWGRFQRLRARRPLHAIQEEDPSYFSADVSRSLLKSRSLACFSVQNPVPQQGTAYAHPSVEAGVVIEGLIRGPTRRSIILSSSGRRM